MGIQDRDYMKRPSDGGDDDYDSSLESKAEAFAQRALARSRKGILICGILLGIIIIAAFIASKLSGNGH